MAFVEEVRQNSNCLHSGARAIERASWGAAGFGYPTFVPSRGLAISPWETGPLAQPRTLF